MWEYISENYEELVAQGGQHLKLVLASLLVAACIGIPTGYYLSKNEHLARFVLSAANVVFTLPSVVVFGLLMPLLAPYGYGIGAVPAFIALVIYAQLPILRNTYVAFSTLDRSLLLTGSGVGMTGLQRLMWVEIPNATPIIMAGIRNAAVMNVAIATLAAYIGAGGLGQPIARGIASTNMAMASAGAILVALLAVALDLILSQLQARVTSPGITTV